MPIIKLIENYDYFNSDEEIFARWHTIKSKMLKSSAINSIDQKVSWKDFLKGLSDDGGVTVNLKPSDIQFIFFADIDKLEQLN